jgi:hypothetical protein
MPWVWQDDEQDAQAARSNLLTYAAAARAIGRDGYTRFVKDRIADGSLIEVERQGRSYVTEASCAAYVKRCGSGPSLSEELAELQRTCSPLYQSRVDDARRQVEAETRAFGLPAASSPMSESRDIPDPGDDFVRRFGRG